MKLGKTNGTHQPIEDLLEELDDEGIRGTNQTIGSFNGLRIVVTGKVPGFFGDAIERKLKSLGARPSHDVGRGTGVLVIGDNAGMAKVKKAREFRVPVISVPELLSAMS